MRLTGIESSLLHRPCMAFVTILVLLRLALSLRRIAVWILSIGTIAQNQERKKSGNQERKKNKNQRKTANVLPEFRPTTKFLFHDSSSLKVANNIRIRVARSLISAIDGPVRRTPPVHWQLFPTRPGPYPCRPSLFFIVPFA